MSDRIFMRKLIIASLIKSQLIHAEVDLLRKLFVTDEDSAVLNATFVGM
jgi:hypothetical protein